MCMINGYGVKLFRVLDIKEKVTTQHNSVLIVTLRLANCQVSDHMYSVSLGQHRKNIVIIPCYTLRHCWGMPYRLELIKTSIQPVCNSNCRHVWLQIEEEQSGDSFDLQISVTEPHKVGDGMTAYMSYKVVTRVRQCVWSGWSETW